jgi:hypothetical protein
VILVIEPPAYHLTLATSERLLAFSKRVMNFASQLELLPAIIDIDK